MPPACCYNTYMKTILVICLMSGLIAGVAAAEKTHPPLGTVPSVDLERYMGTWYEISSFPQRFQKGCHCSMAEYEMTDKGYVRVINSCRKNGPSGKLKVARGKAFVAKGSGNAKLKVQFFWPFKGDYWIIDLADDYSYAAVGAPNREYLWILSRTPEMDEALYQQILGRIQAKGFDITRLRLSDQSCHSGG